MNVAELKQFTQFVENELMLKTEHSIIFPENDTHKMRFVITISVSSITRKLAAKILDFDSFIKIEIDDPKKGDIYLICHFKAE